MTILQSGEHIDDLFHGGMKLIQNAASPCFAVDAPLLADFTEIKSGSRVIDLGTGSGVILLEEPEINLNSGVVEQLPEFIARMQRNEKRQVLVTTHSYDMLSSIGISTDEVAVLETSPEGTKVKALSEIPSLQAVVDAGFSIADAALPAIKPSTAGEMNTKL